MNHKAIVKCAILISTFLIFENAVADDLVSTFRRLIQVRSLKCTFQVGLAADWESGKVKTSKLSSDNMVLHFDSIDLKKGVARLIGGAGAADVSTVLTSSHLSFIEKTDVGNLNFTTVFPFYEKGTHNFAAVTSRHVTIVDKPLPSQYHGTCQVWE